MQIHRIATTLLKQNRAYLHSIVDDLIADAGPMAVHNKNFIINNIPVDLQLQANDSIVTSVLSKLFTTVIRHTQNSGIMISAKVYGMVVLVQVRSSGTVSPGLPEDMGYASLKAQKTGGVVE